VEPIHEPAGTDQPEAHAGRRLVLVPENPVELPDAGTVVRHPHQEDLGRSPALQHEVDLAALGVLEGIAGDLGRRRRQAGLVLHVEAEKPGDGPSALPGQNHAVPPGERDRQEGQVHWGRGLATTTVTSSWGAGISR
jgi:hypothetical protein